jgi:hypothetical protein
MTQDAEKRSEESTATNNHSRRSKIQKIVSIALVVLFIISSIALMFIYSLKIFNSVVNANAAATTVSQTKIAYNATQVPTRTAVAEAQATAIAIASNITATAIVQTNATAQAEASASSIPYPPNGGTLVLDDSLTDNSKGYNWEQSSDNYGSCGFVKGAYQAVSQTRGSFEYCLATPTSYANFIYQVQMTIVKGDGGGLVFRADDTGQKFYRLLINQDGSYRFSVFDHPNQDVVGTTLLSGSNPAINTGLHTPNIVAIVVHGNVFELYVNLRRIAVVGDYSYKQGTIGTFATDEESLTTVIFQNAKVWLV